MNPDPDCDECRRLLEMASGAITRQLRAIAQLDHARIHPDTNPVSTLEADVRDAQLARENAVAAYREHRRKHAAARAQRA